MGLTKAAVTSIVNDLIANGIILETESRTTSSGRPPVVLEVNPDQGMVAAIDMGAIHLSVALGDFSARILEEVEVPFRIADGPGIPESDAIETLTAASPGSSAK